MIARHTVTLANSIVGVSVLAMPFCFKQCGIVLATLSLMTGAIMTRMVCYFLLKAALMNRRRTYEMLAWSTFGHTGKFMVEISIVGFLFGTLIAFMVVIGDLGPEILSEIFSVENNSSLRTIIMTALSLFVALPLGLLRNIDSLSSVSTASVLFYLFLVLKIFSEGIGPLWSGEYLERIHFWKSGGVLQCIPIFSMALSCQTQIFGIYDALPEPSLQKMNEIVKQAVNICTFFYFCVGFFGYIAFSQQNFGGNILLSFSPAWSTQLIKSMFLMSIVFSVPLVVFPCRASLHSMIFKSSCLPDYKYSLLVGLVKGSTYHQVHDMSTNYIPESRLKFLTVAIVGSTLVVGILIPNIELVLGLVGSTTGSVICIIFPSIMFVRVTSKNTTERLLAQGMFFIGVVLMLLTTYATLYAAEQAQVNEKIQELRVTENMPLLKPGLREDVQLNSPISKVDEGKKITNPNKVEFHRHETVKTRGDHKQSSTRVQDVSSPKANIDRINVAENVNVADRIQAKSGPNVKKKPLMGHSEQKSGDLGKLNAEEPRKDKISPPPKASAVDRKEKDTNKKLIQGEVVSSNNMKVAENHPGGSDNTKKEFVDKKVAEEFLKRLEVHQENQKKLIEEQKEILEELKQHHAHDVQDKIEKEKHSENDNVKVVEDKDKLNENIQPKQMPKQKPVVVNQINAAPSSDSVRPADKIIQQQETIIAKISENIEKENKNAQLLEKFEEGLNKEVQMMDAQKSSSSPKEEHKQSPPKTEGNMMEQEGRPGSLGNTAHKSSKQDIQQPNVNENAFIGSSGAKQEHANMQNTGNMGQLLDKVKERNDQSKDSNTRTNILPSNKIPSDVKAKNINNLVMDNSTKPLKGNLQANPSEKKSVSESVVKEKQIDREI